ncbi:hypothetical protein LVO79_21195 (plasmid) [Roseivivax marinus]|uniref:hypothetical protein n=1 Tax=Roseivivax marinus TaxID=1379903 RepID=UPI001F035047|nr:hypothetical protein [Roseivivax marinus]UMA67307.1 hypothetical protein LVO79_21195 [Roseivivax marinus]
MAKPVKEDFGWQGSSELEAALTEIENDLSDPTAVATFDQVLRLNTGAFMPPKQWAKQRRAAERLERQTEDLCDALESEGIQARLETNITRMSLIDGQTTRQRTYRNVCFLPSIAKKNRRDQLNDLAYYLENIDGSYWRYLVITFGERIPAHGDLAGAITSANEKMAKWRERVLTKLGVQVGFTGLEFPRNPDGSYHLHANVLIQTPLFFDGGAEFRELTHRHFGTWWRDNGRIGDLRELVKYPFKPNSMEGADPAELAWLFHSTFRRRITRLMGPIAEFRRGRKEDGLRVFRLRNRYRLREVAQILPAENAESEDEDEKDGPGGGGENILVARAAPSFLDGMWASPSILIWNYNPKPAEANRRSHKRLETVHRWMADARADWELAGAPDPLVAREMAAAALRDDGDTNLRALWRRESAADSRGIYIVHNETISSPDDDGGGELVIEDDPDPPPNNVIQLRTGDDHPEDKSEIERSAVAELLSMFDGEVVW